MPKPTFFHLPEQKRQTVETAAVNEFAERGFEAASISQIVAAAGISKGSFYQYFTDKQDLFMHLVDLAAAEKQAFFQNQPPPGPHMPFFAYLRWMFEAGFAYAQEQSKLNQAVSRVLFGEGLFLHDVFRQMRDHSSRMFQEMIQRAVDQGDIDPAVDPAVGAFVIESLLNALGLFLLTQQPIQQEDLSQGQINWLHSERAKQIIDNVLYVLEKGLGKAQQHHPAPGTEANGDAE